MSTLDSTIAGFGANEWMVEEMREAWLADPSSVTPVSYTHLTLPTSDLV